VPRRASRPGSWLIVVVGPAHAFHDGVPFVFPRSWLMELFADMALYAFVAAGPPGGGAVAGIVG
jgi:hypothetical protein